MADAKFDMLALSGSLRKGSFNAALLRCAQEMAPDDVAIETYDYSDIPLYNGDVEAAGFPASVVRLKERISKADAVLFAVPEYNYSFPGVLKNMVDWCSRPYGKGVWGGRGAALVSTGGGLGGARAQYHFRQVLVSQGMHVLHAPEVFVANAATKFDADGRLTDDVARGLIGQVVAKLRDLSRKMAAA